MDPSFSVAECKRCVQRWDVPANLLINPAILHVFYFFWCWTQRLLSGSERAVAIVCFNPYFLQPQSVIPYAKLEGLVLFFQFMLKPHCQFEIKTLLAVWLWPEHRCEWQESWTPPHCPGSASKCFMSRINKSLQTSLGGGLERDKLLLTLGVKRTNCAQNSKTHPNKMEQRNE